MSLIRSFLINAARKVAADPRARAKAAEVVEREVQPKVSAARDELRDLAAQANPLEDPLGFAKKLKARVDEVNKYGKD